MFSIARLGTLLASEGLGRGHTFSAGIHGVDVHSEATPHKTLCYTWFVSLGRANVFWGGEAVCGLMVDRTGRMLVSKKGTGQWGADGEEREVGVSVGVRAVARADGGRPSSSGGVEARIGRASQRLLWSMRCLWLCGREVGEGCRTAREGICLRRGQSA